MAAVVHRFCPSCGTSRSADLRFCGSCGFDLEATGAPTVSSDPVDRTLPDAPNTDPRAITCPSGGHPQAVQKVSAVFAAGASVSQGVGSASTTSIRYSQRGGIGVASGGGPTEYHETRYTALAAMLAPPDEPQYESPWGWRSRLWVGFWLLAILAVPGGVSRAPADIAVPVLLVDVASIAILIWIPVWHKRRTAARRREILGERHPRWETLMTRWDRSFYCHKDGIVFLPDEPGIPAPAFAESMVV